MSQRVHFLFGMVAAGLVRPCAAEADPEPSPDASPSASPGAVASPKPAARDGKPAAHDAKPAAKPHVHGPNGIVTMPEHKRIEWTSEVLDGPEFRLSAYRGKVVFVNVFATWCEPCRDEQPDVVAFARAHADDTAMIGIDVGEEDRAVRAYRTKFDIAYPIAMDRYDRTVRSVYRQGRMVFPMTVVFRPDGTLSCAWSGNRGRAWFERERAYALQPADA